MPGSSLWLLPPPTHPLHHALNTLIHSTLPARFPREAASSARVAPHFFPAHVTLTSEVAPARYGADPQGWLDGIPAFGMLAGARVRFEKVAGQDVFYRRCFVRVGFAGVRALAGAARAVGVLGEEVAVGVAAAATATGAGAAVGGVCGSGEVVFGEETEKWLSSWREEFGPHVSLMYGDEPIADETLNEITKVVQQAGIRLSEEETEGSEQGSEWDGWDGGVIWLVPTDKPISEWGKPIATRQL